MSRSELVDHSHWRWAHLTASVHAIGKYNRNISGKDGERNWSEFVDSLLPNQLGQLVDARYLDPQHSSTGRADLVGLWIAL